MPLRCKMLPILKEDGKTLIKGEDDIRTEFQRQMMAIYVASKGLMIVDD